MNLSSKRLSPLTRTITYELLRLLTKIQGHHNMVGRVKKEYLNLVEKKIHTPAKPLELHLFDVSLNYYNDVGFNKSKQKDLEQTIEIICTELLSNGVFKAHETSKCWILEKYFFCLEYLSEIHDEHSGKIPTIKKEVISEEEIESWGDLYT
jgi:hypothetical protein